MKILSYLIYFILFSTSFNQNYIWPTNASNTLTAFFCEERPRRYHAGIDIRTYGLNGLEVYAIEDGYIEKIKINYKGYGNTIYLRLNDGNIAVYAHLEKFYPYLDDIVNILKKTYNNQVIEHTFNKQEIVVKKGDIIGYTGDTGTISGPHLHFEIRDKNNISINPLINFYKIKDNISPIPEKIALIPITNNTKIDGFSDIKTYDIIKGGNSEYYIVDTISVIDKFGISLNAIDKINNQPFEYGLYKIELFIDGDMKYKIEYKEHDFNQGHLVDIERNYHLKRENKERYYNLYAENTDLSFIDKRSWPYYELTEGIHNIVIKASDVNDNNIIIFGTIISLPKKELIYEIKDHKDSVQILIDKEDISSSYVIDICNKYNGDTKETIETNEKTIKIDKSLLNEPFTVINLYAKKSNGLKTKKYYYKNKKRKNNNINGKFKIKTFKHGALVQFLEDEFSNEVNTEINLISNDSTISYSCNRIEQNVFTTEIIDYKYLDNLKMLEIRYKSNPTINIREKINASLFIPNHGLYIPHNEFSINEQNNFLNDTMLVWINNNNTAVPNNTELILGPYNIYPKTIPFSDELEINFNYKNQEKGIGIYYYDDKVKKWIYLKTKYIKQGYSTSILSNEIVCLIKETNPPIIKNLIPDINATYRSEDIDKIEFFIEDDLSGISGIENISVKIDEIPILFEYNSYRKKIYYNFEDWLSIGKHSLEINITDNVGNQYLKKGEFIIK